MSNDELVQRINAYLILGGLFNPELADHDAVRALLIDCRNALAEKHAPARRLVDIEGAMGWLG